MSSELTSHGIEGSHGGRTPDLGVVEVNRSSGTESGTTDLRSAAA